MDSAITDILINLTLVGKKASGLTRFAQELISACEQLSDFKKLPVTYLFGKGNYSSWNTMPGRRCYYLPNIFSVDNSKLSAIARYLVPPDLLVPRRGFLFTPSYQGNIFSKRQIITIFDLIPLLNLKEDKWQYVIYKYLLPRVLKRASHIITISNVTKKAIIEKYNIPSDKITVIYCAVDPKKFKHDKSIAKNDHLLVVGAYNPHKNTHELLENYNLWSSKYTLDIISRDSPYLRSLRELCETYGISERVNFIPWMEDRLLVAKYRQARALVYPSTQEGFGMPPLEAMSSGTPVIISDIPVHREVCGDAAIYIRHGDRQSWQSAFDMLDQDKVVDDYMLRGLERLRQFSWANSARRFTDFLQTILR